MFHVGKPGKYTAISSTSRNSSIIIPAVSGGVRVIQALVSTVFKAGESSFGSSKHRDEGPKNRNLS